jgi:hypothetical protein
MMGFVRAFGRLHVALAHGVIGAPPEDLRKISQTRTSIPPDGSAGGLRGA